jgi:hypothetical protein
VTDVKGKKQNVPTMCKSAYGDKHPTEGEKFEDNDIKVLVMRFSNAYYTQ